MQILYVEDDPAQAKIVEAMLASEDHFCHCTDSGEQAVLLTKRNDYDLIILDIMLPDIDGYEVMRRMQAAGVRTPCLIQSGFVDFDPLLDGQEFGVYSCLLKPFSKVDLFRHIDNLRVRSKQAGSFTQGDMPERGKETPTRGSELRQTERFATVKLAEIFDGDERLACVVLNLSKGGALIRLPGESLPCASTFGLRLESGTMHLCQACWSTGDKIGVRFIGADNN